MKRLNPETLPREAAEVRRLLAQFSGKLRIHAAMENEALYPRLLDDPDEEVRAVARRLLAEVGGLYEEFDGYTERWATAAQIAERPREFVNDTMKVMQRLGARMTREGAELYPLADERG